MKPRLYAFLALLLLSAAAIVFYFTAAVDWSTFVNHRALAQLSEAFHSADSVLVYKLSSTPKSPSDRTYSTKKYPDKYYLTDSTTLDKSQTTKLSQALGKLSYVTGVGAACHDPGYLLIFKKNDHEILSCSLCLHCSNFELSPLPFTSVWASFLYQPKDSTLTKGSLEQLLEPKQTP